jgi:hypothetical protein
MWFRKKTKNRRNDRESVLEVRMRSRDARRARLRAITGLVGAVGGTTLGVLVIWEAYQWALHKFVYGNEAYAIRRIELRHHGRLLPDQIRRWSGVEHGQNLLAIDLDRVRQDLEMIPWVQRAEVEALRPDCLRLGVWEREPLVQVVVWRLNPSDGVLWPETNYLDADGVVLPPLLPQWMKAGELSDFGHLTRLTGLDRVEVVPGQRITKPRVRAALELVRAYEASSMYSVVDVEEIDVSGQDTLVGVLKQGARVTFGLMDFERQMRLWRSIHDYTVSRTQAIEWLDLSLTNNLPAKLRDVSSTIAPGSSPPASPSRPAKPQRNRRTPHV